MDPLSVTASIVAILQLSAKVLSYLNDVKDAPKDRAKCAVEVSNLHSLLLSLRFHLEEEEASQSCYVAVRELAVENGPLDEFKQALETLQARMTDGGRLKKASNALMWKFKKEEISEVLARIERLKTHILVALHMDQFKLSKAVKADTKFVREHVSAIHSGVETIQGNQDSAKHSKLLKWISASDYPAQQSSIIKNKQEGTGQWFLNTHELAHWINESRATLFCPGIPGAGKTMIAAIAIDHLLNTVQDSSHGVAYVYCNYKAREEQEISSLLAAILKQLVQGQLSKADRLEELYLKHADRGTKPSLFEIYDTLRDVIASYQSVYIVVDALDECHEDTRCQFLAKLRDLQAIHDIRLMVTSRFMPDIKDALSRGPSLEVQASREDVKRFVAGQMHTLSPYIQHDTELQKAVQEKIADAADGMFLLAFLYTNSLRGKITTKKVKEILSKLKKGAAGLEDAYDTTLQRIDSQSEVDCKLAREVLSWITLAERQLTTAEICCALAIEDGEDEIDPENVRTLEDLISVCAGLVTVDQESDIIRLVHYTTQEYFERTGDLWNPRGHVYIATTCLKYLSFSAFQSGSCPNDKEFRERLQQNSFLDYAAKYWARHAKPVEAEVAARACELLQGNSFSSIEEVLFASDYKYNCYSTRYPVRTPLHYTSQFGLPDIAEKVLATVNVPIAEAVNAKDSRGWTPLISAAQYGQPEMVQLLLRKGAEISAQGGGFKYGNALQAASKEGHERIVRMLLDAGAEVNAQGGKYGNALQAASYMGQEKIVKTLLDVGAEVNAQGGEYSNALQAACYSGQEEIVGMLLDAGAEVNAQGGKYGNALQAASYMGQEKIVKTLLDVGAEVNAQGGEYGNALQAASAEGDEQIVKILLNAGANINAQSEEHGNALQAASVEGYGQVVKALLNAGADVNVQGGKYGTALQAASYEGYVQIVKMLLNAGAEVNAQGGEYSSALQAASCEGHERVVKILLNAAQDGFYIKALCLASVHGHEHAVEILLNTVADSLQKGDPVSRPD
ncbi:ankyrin repeat domain-containing protein [Bipolaris maydis]|nr:ankyrin repeat domain-containing protein [Bipolaris maydis]